MARPRCSPATLRRLRGLGRPIPVQCPGGERIEVKTYTRCRPPKRGQKRDRSEPLLEHARNQPEPEAPSKPTKKARKLSPREESKNLERQQNIESAAAALRRLVRDTDHIPTERDVRPNQFLADPCTGEQYETWRGNYPKSHASYTKPLAWSEKIATCARQAWCAEKGPCDEDEVDTSFNPAEFMDGLGRRRRRGKLSGARKTMAKKTAGRCVGVRKKMTKRCSEHSMKENIRHCMCLTTRKRDQCVAIAYAQLEKSCGVHPRKRTTPKKIVAAAKAKRRRK